MARPRIAAPVEYATRLGGQQRFPSAAPATGSCRHAASAHRPSYCRYFSGETESRSAWRSAGSRTPADLRCRVSACGHDALTQARDATKREIIGRTSLISRHLYRSRRY